MKNNIFKKFLTPYLITDMDLIRLGNNNDGGYIIPSFLANEISKLISVGIADDISFELDLLKRNKSIKIFCFDHTIDDLPIIADRYEQNFHFMPWGLGIKHDRFANCDRRNIKILNTDKLMDIFSLFNKCDIACDDKVMLKIDVEGAEWDCGLDKFDFSLIDCFIIELHSMIRQYKYTQYEKCLKKICEEHLCVHVHGNNAGGLFSVEGMSYPGMIEVTFLNKKYIYGREYTISPYKSPREIDQKNVKQKDEIVFEYWS